MLVGREKELHLLHDIQNDDSSHFVAVYGRRRVGKTFLIREAFGYRFAFQHAGLSEGGMKEQIYAFTSSLKDAGYEVSCRGWTHKRVILWLLWRISRMDLLLQEKI